MVDRCKTLLPNNHSRTSFTKKLECSAAPSYGDDIIKLRRIRHNPSKDLRPYIVWEYGLIPITPFFKNKLKDYPQVDLKKVLEEGIPWQQERGTEKGILRGLSWIDENNNKPFLEEEVVGPHWNEIQLDPDYIPDDEHVKNIRKVTQLSSRAVTELKRLYHGYDVRRLVLDNGNTADYGDVQNKVESLKRVNTLDDNLLDDYSGVHIDGLVRSFGRDRKEKLIRKKTPTARITARLHVTTGTYAPHWVLDKTPIFGEMELKSPFGAFGRIQQVVADISQTKGYYQSGHLHQQRHTYQEVVTPQDYESKPSFYRSKAQSAQSIETKTEINIHRNHTNSAIQHGQYWIAGVTWNNAQVSWNDADYTISGVLHARTG